LEKKLEVYVCRKVLDVIWCYGKLEVGGSWGWTKHGHSVKLPKAAFGSLSSQPHHLRFPHVCFPRMLL
jgi:hypothetical protein